MRTLLLFRGAPGSGKSTLIKKLGLEKYTISADAIRMLYASPEMTATGEFVISQKNDKIVWDNLMGILKDRFSRGEFTVVDAVNSKTADMKKYKDLCDEYRYRIFIIDMTDVPIDVCKKQNKMRDKIKWVPDEVIDNIYSRFETQTIPSGITVIKKDEFDSILEKPIDLSKYKKIVHIGDIHGCYTTLMEYFKDGLSDDICYIFCGDYLDRGSENAEVFKFINSIKDKENVCLLEGNHERHLKLYGLDQETKSKEFNEKTAKQLENAEISKKEIRILYRKFRQMSHYIWNEYEILACHGGIPTLKTNLLYLPADNFVKGVGNYNDYEIIADTWMQTTKKNQYLIHGHRNTNGSETQVADRVFNLEGGIEFGGCLRIVELDKDGFHVKEIKSLQPVETIEKENIEGLTDEECIKILKNDKFVSEKKLGNDISSFNFTRAAFYDRNWNQQTILARGLFVNTAENYIVARSYEKFFRINELPETELGRLNQTLVFPVNVYKKENGFLAIIAYNKKTDDLFIASKSTNTGEYVEYINNILDKIGKRKAIKNYLKCHSDYSMVFECIDPVNDPHIIEEPEQKLVLLDIIRNTFKFKKLPYSDVVDAAKLIDIPVKELAYTLNNWEEFSKLYEEITSLSLYSYKRKYIEGFVFEDSNGFMTKIKTEYYNEWKKLRGVAESVFKYGYIRKTSMLQTPLENHFYAYCKKLYKKYNGPTDIITLRKNFLISKGLF